MAGWISPFRWLRNAGRLFFRRGRLEKELDDELDSYRQILFSRRVSSGEEPARAWLAVNREIGRLETVRDRVREVRMGASLDSYLKEIHLSVRGLLRDRGFTAMALLTTALAIGGGTAIFSVFQVILLDPLPYRNPDRLMWVWSDLDQAGYVRAPLSGPEILDLREQSRSFQDFAAIQSFSMQLTAEGPPLQLQGGIVTANFFQVLGVDPVLGRDFQPEEEGSNSSSLLLGGEVWQSRFGSDPEIVGSRIEMDGSSFQVVGVLPPNLRLLFPAEANIEANMQFWIPRPGPLNRLGRSTYFLRTLGRLRPEATWSQARHEVEEITRRIVPGKAEYATSGRSFYVVPLQEDSTRRIRSPLLAAGAGIGLLILLACSNVAHLIVGRTLRRLSEFSLRAALGASRLRLLRQMLTEGALLGAAGGGLGVLVAVWGIRLFTFLKPSSLAHFESFRLSARSLGVALLLALATTLIFSLVPLLELSRLDLNRALKGERGVGRGRQIRGPLILLESALVVVLLVGTGLTARTLYNLNRLDPGYQPRDSMTFKLSLPRGEFSSIARVTALTRDLESRLGAIPGVESVGVLNILPLDNLPNWSSAYLFQENAAEERGSREADVRAVGPGAFEALGATLLEGRFFLDSDDSDSEKVVLVDNRLAERNFPGQSVLGKMITVDYMLAGRLQPVLARIVGVVSHLRHRELTQIVREQVFVPFRQSPRNPLALLLRAQEGSDEALVAAIRERVAQVNPQLAPFGFQRLSELVNSATSSQRFTALMSAVFALNALLIAAVGIFGVVSYAVRQRLREVGIRTSLGARPAQLQLMLARGALKWSGLGLLLGLGIAFATRGMLAELLFEVPADDLPSYAGAALVLAWVALLASWIPARKALKMSPSEILGTD